MASGHGPLVPFTLAQPRWAREWQVSSLLMATAGWWLSLLRISPTGAGD